MGGTREISGSVLLESLEKPKFNVWSELIKSIVISEFIR